ncbi:MAG: hypothetical protein Q4F65_11295 [Propionibacteriaceae bacterium]|nr:hypothetical protein [Propionibacteriaceae bacterium]
MSDKQPPTPRYKLTLTIIGNTLDEVERELTVQTRGGFLIDSDYYARDEWHSISGRVTSRMEHTNPTMTPEQYDADMRAWFERRRQQKANR